MAVNEDRTSVHDQGRSLGRAKLGTWSIVFMVFAAMTPLVGLSSTTGLALAFGGGIGIVGVYLIVAVCVLLFQVGYSAMSTEITNTGAFYAYISRGFGRTSGLAAALLSTLYYIMITVVLTAFFAFYASLTLSDQLGVSVPWQVCAVVALALVFVLGRLNLAVSSQLLGIAVVLETLMMVVFVIGTLAHQGVGAFTLAVFTPQIVFGSSVGITLLFALYAFGGIESNAIFAEEARNPRLTVRRAGLIAPVLLGVFYALGSWTLVAAFGAADAPASAQADPGTVFFVANTAMVGAWSTGVIQWLLLFSLFAAILGVHNLSNRYLFALGRDRVLPLALSRTSPLTHAPSRAGEVQIAITLVLLVGFMLADADPIVDIATGFGGVIVLISTFLWAWVSAAAAAYFWPRKDVSLARTKLAPLLSTVIMLALCGAILSWYTDLTGASGPYTLMPLIIPIVLAAGVSYALWLRRNRPEIYAAAGQLSLDDPAATGSEDR